MSKDDNIKVAIRVRPLNNQEQAKFSKQCIEVVSDTEISIDSASSFTGNITKSGTTMEFDYIANQDSQQKDIFTKGKTLWQLNSIIV